MEKGRNPVPAQSWKVASTEGAYHVDVSGNATDHDGSLVVRESGSANLFRSRLVLNKAFDESRGDVIWMRADPPSMTQFSRCRRISTVALTACSPRPICRGAAPSPQPRRMNQRQARHLKAVLWRRRICRSNSAPRSLIEINPRPILCTTAALVVWLILLALRSPKERTVPALGTPPRAVSPERVSGGEESCSAASTRVVPGLRQAERRSGDNYALAWIR